MAGKTLSKTKGKSTEPQHKTDDGTVVVVEDPKEPTIVPGTASVPPQNFYDSYISRQISKGKSEFDVFDFARKSKMNVLIEGPTGPGKTSAVMAYAAREGRPFYAIPSNVGIEPSQLFGKFIPDGQGSFVWIDGPVTELARNGGVLLINEVNFVPERVATALFGLLDKRRQIILLDHKSEVIDAHDDLLIVADMNPDYEGTRRLNKAFRNRFAIQLFWDYDPKVEASLVQSENLRNIASKIRADVAQGLYSTPVSTNMLMEFEKIATQMDFEFALMNFCNHFAPDERPAIKGVLDTARLNIEDDLNPPETVEDFDMNDPLMQKRMNADDGYVDPEWGVKGVDWIWDDDDIEP